MSIYNGERQMGRKWESSLKIGLSDEEETQNYFAILDKTNGENQWNSCGINRKSVSKESVSPSNLMT